MRKPKYKLEKEIEQFFDRAGRYLFVKPKNKMDKIVHTMELISWILLTAAIIFRMGG